MADDSDAIVAIRRDNIVRDDIKRRLRTADDDVARVADDLDAVVEIAHGQ